MAGRTPKQTIGDAKKRKGNPATVPMPKLSLPKVGNLPDLGTLRTWVKPTQAKAITAKAKRVAIGKIK